MWWDVLLKLKNIRKTSSSEVLLFYPLLTSKLPEWIYFLTRRGDNPMSTLKYLEVFTSVFAWNMSPWLPMWCCKLKKYLKWRCVREACCPQWEHHQKTLWSLPTCCSNSIYKAVYVLHVAFSMISLIVFSSMLLWRDGRVGKNLLIHSMTYVSLVAFKHIIVTKDTNGHIWQKTFTSRGKQPDNRKLKWRENR